MRLLRADLRKLVRRPASWVTLALLIGLNALVLLALFAASRVSQDPEAALSARLVFTFPNAYSMLLAFVMAFGPLFAVAYGGAIAGSEWSWGTLKAAIARGESRSRYTLAGWGSVVVAVWVGLVVTYLASILIAILLAVASGTSLAGLGDIAKADDLGERFLRTLVALSMTSAFGFAIATVARSQLAGIVVGIGLYFAEGIAGLFLPEVFKWFPFAAASAATSTGGTTGIGGGGGGGGQGLIQQLDPTTGLVVTVAWLVGALVVASLWTERAEIGG